MRARRLRPAYAASMDASPDAIAITDRLLLEHGEFDPIEFLLRRGWIDGAELLAWRRGELATLQAALSVELAPVIASLEAAIRYGKAQGLRREPRPAPTGHSSGQPLLYGSDPHLSLLCAGLLRPPPERSQGDLFRDNAEGFAVDALRETLAAASDETRHEAAIEALCRLRQRAPALAEAWAPLVEALADDRPALSRISTLSDTLTPLARRLLKARSRDYLSARWARLGEQLADQPFDAQQPERHASHAWMQAGHWRQAAASIAAIEGWIDRPLLLARMATVQARQHRLGDARRWRMQLCWRHPPAAAQHFDGLDADDPDRALRRGWQAFNEAELQLPVPLFPAWLLLADPQQGQWLATDAMSGLPVDAHATRVWLLIHQLLAEPGDVELRRQLKVLQPELLRAFLGLRERRGL